MSETPSTVRWRVHLVSAPERVWEFLATDAGRARFWAESAVERDGIIDFRFANGARFSAPILRKDPLTRLSLEYFGKSRLEFKLLIAADGGVDLEVEESRIPESEWLANHAGWVSVLLTLKAAVDHGIDLRNHDPLRTWDEGFVDP